jgi:hypothetical protein
MSDLDETVYIGHDNAVRLMLLEDGTPFGDKYPTVTPDRFVISFGAVRIDSDQSPTAFRWIADESTLEISIGPVVTEEYPPTSAKIVVYAAPWPNGIVWVHPTRTPDHLYLRVTE